MASILLLICVAISIVHLCIGTSVFLKAPRERTNQAFYLAIISMIAWMLITTASSVDWLQLGVRDILTRSAYASGMVASSTIAIFFVVFSNKGKIPLRELVVIAIVSVTFIFLSFYPGAIVNVSVHNEAGAVETNGPLRPAFYVAVAAIFFYALLLASKRYKEADLEDEKIQLRLLGIGIFAPAAISITSFSVLPLLIGSSPLQTAIGPVSTVIFIILAGYATLKQGHFIELDLAPDHVFESISVGVCVVRTDGRILRHNGTLVKMLAYPGRFTGLSLDHLVDFLDPNMEERVSLLKKWLQEERPDPVEITLSGLRNKAVELSANPLKDRRGRIVGKIILFHDITERKQLKEEIRASEENYRTLVESADDIIFTLDLEGNFTFFNNRTSERITDYKAEDFLGMNFREILVPGEEEHIVKHAQEAYEGKPQRFEAKVFHRSGKILTLWNSLSPIVIDGNVVGYSVVARDITETKELEQQLRESEEKYRTLVEESENIVYIIQDGCLKFVNRHGIEIRGYSERELCSADFVLHHWIHPDDHADVAEAFTAIREGHADHIRLEARFVSKHQRVYDCIMTAASLAYRGQPAIMGVMVDITEKKQLQRQLIQSEKLAAIGQLVSGVAHELNNPLAAIMGYSQLLSESEDIPPKDRAAAQKVFESSIRCKKIIQNLLSFARKQDIEKIGLNVNDILDRAIELREYNLESHNIQVQRDYASGLKPVAADPQHLQSVFLSLINNASDAMYRSAGKGILRIATRMDGDKIQVDIIDNGPGIPPKFQDKIFDPFFTSKEVGQGAGLGLSISYGIVKEHGGELALDTAYDGGTRFIVELPVGEGRNDKKPQFENVFREGAPFSKPKILVVDDEETILELSVDILENKGYDVDTALNGEVARDMIESNSYDLVVADIRMPGTLSGIDLFYWVKKNVPGFEDRIVFATGDLVAEDTQKFLSETKRPCLSKPFEMSEYLNTVRAAIAASQGVN
jgi:PAS domain S-box-containing protein